MTREKRHLSTAKCTAIFWQHVFTTADCKTRKRESGNHPLQKFTEVPAGLAAPQEVRESTMVTGLTMHSVGALNRCIRRREREGGRERELNTAKQDKHK